MGEVIPFPPPAPAPAAPVELVVLAGMLSVFVPMAVALLLCASVARSLDRAF